MRADAHTRCSGRRGSTRRRSLTVCASAGNPGSAAVAGLPVPRMPSQPSGRLRAGASAADRPAARLSRPALRRLAAAPAAEGQSRAELQSMAPKPQGSAGTSATSSRLPSVDIATPAATSGVRLRRTRYAPPDLPRVGRPCASAVPRRAPVATSGVAQADQRRLAGSPSRPDKRRLALEQHDQRQGEELADTEVSLTALGGWPSDRDHGEQ